MRQFTGKERDSESGLDYFGARYYGSALGRFTSPDPLLNSGRPWLPQSWNRYVYSLNNPLRFIDPSGLWEWDRKKCRDDGCENDRTKFRSAVQTLRDAMAQSQEGSAVYNALKKALDAIGTEGDGNDVRVAFDSQQKNPGLTAPAITGKIKMTFNFSRMDNPLTAAGYKDGDSAFGIAEAGDVLHEGTHGAEGLSRNVKWLFSPQERSNWEGRAYDAESLFYQKLNNDPYGVLWNASFAAAGDANKVEETRRKAVEDATEKDYGRKPKIY